MRRSRKFRWLLVGSGLALLACSDANTAQHAGGGANGGAALGPDGDSAAGDPSSTGGQSPASAGGQRHSALPEHCNGACALTSVCRGRATRGGAGHPEPAGANGEAGSGGAEADGGAGQSPVGADDLACYDECEQIASFPLDGPCIAEWEALFACMAAVEPDELVCTDGTVLWDVHCGLEQANIAECQEF